jgi:hypothetical protein
LQQNRLFRGLKVDMATVIKLPVIHRRIPTPLSRFMGREKRYEKVERSLYLAVGLSAFMGIFATAHHGLGNAMVAKEPCVKCAEGDVEQIRVHNLKGRAEAGTNNVAEKASPIG